jgi:ubiquinone/menaquinone biosynthesis C-methylase UbiE
MFNQIINIFWPTETIEHHKRKWEDLAKKDANYYCWTRKENVDEEALDDSGKQDYEFFIEDIKRGGVALELGCGVGRITKFLGEDFEKVYGVDISGEMVRKAKERITQDKFLFLENNGKDIPLEDNSVDFVLAWAVFQHMPSDEVIRRNFQEVNRVLKPGGYFKVGVRRIQTDKRKWFYGVHYNEEQAKRLCEDSGFNIINQSDFRKSMILTLRK